MLARLIAIGFGIAVIFPLLIHYGVSTFYPPPKYQPMAATTPLAPNASPEERKDYFDKQRQRQEAYNEAAKHFARILVVVSTPLGIAAILIGAYLSFQAVGTGLIIGGILAVIWGYWSYWRYLDDWLRFVSLLAGFAILLFVGIRRFGVAKSA
jgi:uncharacterized membrane protein YphA (DoxX/SURF4 family)